MDRFANGGRIAEPAISASPTSSPSSPTGGRVRKHQHERAIPKTRPDESERAFHASTMVDGVFALLNWPVWLIVPTLCRTEAQDSAPTWC